MELENASNNELEKRITKELEYLIHDPLVVFKEEHVVIAGTYLHTLSTANKETVERSIQTVLTPIEELSEMHITADPKDQMIYILAAIAS